MTTLRIEPDPFDVRRARLAPGLLRDFNDAGVLTAADVHVAMRLAALAETDDQWVTLAGALAVRAPQAPDHPLVRPALRVPSPPDSRRCPRRRTPRLWRSYGVGETTARAHNGTPLSSDVG